MSDINIKITEHPVSLIPGQTMPLNVTRIPTNVTEVTWATENEGVATVSSGTDDVKKATVTAVALGTTNVTASIGVDGTTYKATCQVTVKNPISLNFPALSLDYNKGQEIKATVPGGVTEVTWKSEDADIATVSSDEKDKTKATIAGKAPGKTEITATINYQGEDYTATCYVAVGGIILDSSELSLIVGETQDFNATVPEKGKKLTWESNNINVAAVELNDEDKKKATIKAVAPGQATISATVKYGDKRYTKKCNVTVKAIRLLNSEVELDVNGDQSITAEVPKDAKVTWTSEDEGIATVSPKADNATNDANATKTTAKATIEAVAPGTTTVTAMIEINKTKYTATCKVKAINKISLDSSAFSFDIGEKQTIKATVPENTIITWESGNTNVATVSNSSGVEATITAVAPGTAEITASINKDYSATCIVTVNKPRLNKDKLTLLTGKNFQLEVIPSGLSVEWSSSNESVASVDIHGLVTARLEGTTKVTAKFGDEYSDTCLVTVEDKALDVLVNLANERFDQYKDVKDKYSFSFTPEGKTDELILVQGEDTQCESDKNVFSFVLTEVSFHKEIYQPGYVEVVIKTNAALSLFGGWVSLEYIKEGEKSPYTIAKNYYIFEKKKKRGYVTLKAYSADQFLTLDKFCQVYTAKTLVAGMVATTFANYGETVNFNKFCTAVGDSLYVENLQHLKTAARIPYAVQYNESFYDFLVRMCNRHGEFLYCEGNQLHIGLQASTVGTEIPDIQENDDVEIECSESGWTYANEVKTMFSDCLKENGVGGEWVKNIDKEGNVIVRPEKQMFVDNSIYPEHYFEMYQKSGEKVDDKKYEYATSTDFSLWSQKIFAGLKSFAECQNLFDASAKTAVKVGIATGITLKFKKEINDKYNETYFDEVKLGGVKKTFYPFSSPNDGLNGDFYNTILQKETEAEKNKVTVVCSTCQKYQLGDRVTIEGIEHVVYRVKGSAKVVDGVVDGVRRYVDSYELLLLPMIGEEEEKKYYPLPMPERRILKASPQRAIVKNNMDPKKLGRVQVVYPWQSVNDTNFSPWLRVAYPMATGEGGFMFFPAIDDEVLVDYEGGNIERPFVAGSFYSADRKPAVPAQMHMTGSTKSITSPNGHHISFTDSNYNAKFLANLIPGWSLASKFGEGVSLDKDFWNTHGKHLVGGFEIADYFGVYSIKGNTESRNISINSPLGDITLDAFSGITINAPHGDVNIVGKNVNIEARNNLTIQSGTNIKQPYFWHRGEFWKTAFGRLVPNFIGGLAKVAGLDLSFHRTWLEVLIRPIGGTMLIKSYRYLCLEAGEGNANIGLKRDDAAHNEEVVRKFRSYSASVASLLLDIRTLIRRIRLIDFPFKDTNNFVPGDINVMKDIIKGKIKENEDFQDEHTWGQRKAYLAGVKAMRKEFQEIKQCEIVDKSKFLKEMVKEYGAAIERLEKGLLGMSEANYDQKIEVKVLGKFDATTSDNCKKILFNSIADYVKGDKDLKLLLRLDESKVDDWTGCLGIDKGIVIGPSKTAMTKAMLLAPLKKTLAYEGFLDDKWWSKLDDGGIVYSVSKGQYKLITKGADNQLKEEIKPHRNADLLSRALTVIRNYIARAGFLDME